MSEFEAGEVVVPVVPDASDFIKKLKKDLLGPITEIGREIGEDLAKGIRDGLGKGDPFGPLKEEQKRQRQQAPKEGDQVGGAFARGFKARLETAFKTLPKAKIDADSSEAARKLDELRTKMAALSAKTVGIDIDAAAAQAELDAIVAELRSIDRESVSVDVDADIAAALAALGVVEEEVEHVDGKTAHVRVDADVSGALAGLAALSAAMAATAAIPVAATLGAGLLATVGATAAAGIGFAGLAAVAVPSLKRISEANKASEKATAAAGAATRNAAVEQAKAQIQALQNVGALDQLKAAYDRVRDAQAAVRAARQRLADVEAQAAARVAAALDRVTQAERSVASAQEDARRAQEDLNRARKEAAQDVEDLANNVVDAGLSLRGANLDLAEAQAELNKTLKDPKATQAQKARAQLSYDQAVQRVKELQLQLERLKQQQAESDAKGVEGSDKVTAAKEREAAAVERIADAERDVAKARADVQAAQVDGERQIAAAKAQIKAAEKQAQAAERAVAAQKRQMEIAKLQDKIAKEQARQAAARSAGGQAKGPALSPAAQAAAAALKSFSDAYVAFQKRLEPSVLPVITGGLKIAQGLFKPLTPLIEGTSRALTGLEKSASKALGGKFWSSFFADLSKQAPTAVTGLGKSLGNVIKGAAGIVKAFLPFTGTIVGGIEKATGAFARFGANLGKSQAFKEFIAYVKANAPTVITLVKNLATFGGNLVKGLAPLGAGALGGLGGIVGLLAKLSPQTLQGIALAIGGIAAAIKTWSVVQQVLNLALRANPIGLVITAVSLLAAGIVWLWTNSETFRTVVTAAWQAVATMVQWAWVNVIQPAVVALVDFWNNVLAPVFTWLWKSVVQPAFNGIAAVVTWLWDHVIYPNFLAWKLILTQVVGPAISWLWKNIVEPAFKAIGSIIKFAWENVIKPAVNAAYTFFKTVLGPVFTWLWKNIIVPAWDGIKAAITTVWNSFLKPVFDKLYDVIFKTIPDGFKRGVGFITDAWNKVKDVAKKPVEFIVNTVYNGGIKKVWDAVAGVLGLPKLPAVAFAKGGVYPGYTPGRDVGLAAVSGGEAIMRPEWTRAVGEKYVHGANSAARSGGVAGVARFLGVAGDPGYAGAFAGGGIVGNIQDALAGGLKVGAEKLLYPLLDSAESALGGSGWAKMLIGVPRTLVKGLIELIGKKEGNGGKAVAYARQQLGKPYQWGATGPNSFDCSGLTLRALQAAGVTGVPRVSQDQMKWVKPVTSPLPGDLGFPHSGHVWMYSGAGKIIEAPHTGANVREVAARAAQVIGRPPQWFDNGGYLMPGTSLVHNGTGRPEPVLTDRQWDRLGQSARGGDKAMVNIAGDFVAHESQSPMDIAQSLMWLSKAGG